PARWRTALLGSVVAVISPHNRIRAAAYRVARRTARFFRRGGYAWCRSRSSMAARSAGLLLYRRRRVLEVFLVHPGGPFFARKDAGAWSIPQGVIEPGEDPLAAARREAAEETGFVGEGEAAAPPPVRPKSGKGVAAFRR